jgi:hypothetical protein
MKQTDSTIKRYKKPKLPRKRKKAAIKAQGRRWYHNTIRLFKICQSRPEVECEHICKFWVNSSIKKYPANLPDGTPYYIPKATKFW